MEGLTLKTEEGGTAKMEEADNQQVEVAAYSPVLRIPSFHKTDPELWFHQVESVFKKNNITSSASKFHTIVPALEFDVLQQASDIVKKPLSTTPYEDLKARLVIAYTESEHRRLQKLLEGRQLGDEKPSHLLRRMKQLAGATIADEMLKTLWMRSLPSSMQASLISTGHTNLEKLAEVADRIQEVHYPAEVYSVAANDEIGNLKEEIRRLTNEIAELKLGRPNDGRTRKLSNSKGRNPNSPDWLCFYHFKFKQNAKKCEQPCSWKRRDEDQSGK